MKAVVTTLSSLSSSLRGFHKTFDTNFHQVICLQVCFQITTFKVMAASLKASAGGKKGYVPLIANYFLILSEKGAKELPFNRCHLCSEAIEYVQ